MHTSVVNRDIFISDDVCLPTEIIATLQPLTPSAVLVDTWELI